MLQGTARPGAGRAALVPAAGDYCGALSGVPAPGPCYWLLRRGGAALQARAQGVGDRGRADHAQSERGHDGEGPQDDRMGADGCEWIAQICERTPFF